MDQDIVANSAQYPVLYESTKRTLDIFLSAAGLILAAPIMTVTAFAIRSTSPGPVIFRQERIGKGGQTFVIYKFRSLRAGSEAFGSPTLPDDPRITRVGRFIRPMHIDELPQLWNVIIGEMSLVGPRPMSLQRYRDIEELIPEYRARLCVKPGLTGMAQIDPSSKWRDAGTKKRFALDLEYIQKRSLMLDLYILTETILVVAHKVSVGPKR
ncbi:MAG: hypothetical protein A2722_03445 [Candidatus Doudnabacteria bacterium RIFCSPHIGHO2_01_FULL_50_11]|uniref:Bacterial sugar transferase domain-containing protein n=1 Tax=Candidatus Doudnabacteria bacterium RIFCSPHIGHO2_01_FULL_50_11 TaxID=1817828 RepID=A0A1F5PIL5_9BACT|nr:MAG: hypothetical protein A2722_03445 [Candidatus Doudnabacteria bacterium RIFCSPHIGHO2_01_FULL_50_11]HLC44284.1 sugar transferase [Patescibacteria group bacterium]